VRLLVAKHGETDEYDLDLGMTEDSIYEHMALLPFDGLVVLVEANQNSTSSSKYKVAKSVNAKFVIGPSKHPFAISFHNEDGEGEQATQIKSDLFTLEDGKFSAPSSEQLAAFFDSAGTINFKSNKYDGDDIEQSRAWYFADVISYCVKLVVKKCEETYQYGVELGVTKDSIYELMALQ